MPRDALRCMWQVVGGIIPDEPEDGLTRRFELTSDDMEVRHKQEVFLARRMEAMSYAESLMDPNRLNWVRVEFLWL